MSSVLLVIKPRVLDSVTCQDYIVKDWVVRTTTENARQNKKLAIAVCS